MAAESSSARLLVFVAIRDVEGRGFECGIAEAVAIGGHNFVLLK